jgi:large subunit ribosomal protein L3
MMIGLIGRKIGMTRVFTEDGCSIPVTVVQVEPNRISQIKTEETDGYSAVQLTAGTKKPSRISKPLAGHFAKAAVEPGDMIVEFRIPDSSISNYELGQLLTIEEVFGDVKKVDVTATSKGKGFAGTVKRHNFRTQDATHGNSRSHRVPGSIGQNQSPGRVFKGKKMSGHLGNVQCTVQTLEIVKLDTARNLVLIKGGIPGAPGVQVKIRPAVKSKEGVN